MDKKWMLRTGAAITLVLGLSCIAMAQQVNYARLQPAEALPEAPVPTEAAELTPTPFTTSRTAAPANTPAAHRFWDRENTFLFAATAAFSSADFVVTRDNLRSGGQELNPVTRVFSGSTGGLAINFAGETAGVVGVSYFFHRMGHHKLERAVSMINIGGSASAVAFGLMHR
jgi:hypothetical protein